MIIPIALDAGQSDILERVVVASVIVCTTRRSSSLRRTLDSLAVQEDCPGAFEVVVVDNGPWDDVLATVESYPEMIYVRHEEPGLSGARNAGIKAARGRYLAFIDDDAVASQRWLASLIKTLEHCPEAGAAGGPIHPLGLAEWPAWVHPRIRTYVSVLDLGPKPMQMHYPRYPFGTNMALRRSAVDTVGLFDPRLGLSDGSSDLTGDETDLFLRLETTGSAILYDPSAIVHHEVHPGRLQPSRFYARGYSNGRAAGVMEKNSWSFWRWGGGGILAGCYLVGAAVVWMWGSTVGREDLRVYARSVMARNRGYFAGLGCNRMRH